MPATKGLKKGGSPKVQAPTPDSDQLVNLDDPPAPMSISKSPKTAETSAFTLTTVSNTRLSGDGTGFSNCQEYLMTPAYLGDYVGVYVGDPHAMSIEYDAVWGAADL